ncbi:TetR/AcrR family transcriptional regulator [Leptospira fletcheri]|uniref:TetR/AcrR family transcriptional regulator n=1 Tax=Leptospira fletcheri TaxID=2484981 RepID=A0A4R9GIS1_9LEPT|nr:TetR/AcrR family transcriptional regulator [Leptospira fletcheri]TGK12895.1 TetR/AcrR family transcriptional regulator [Leptospira fletcheri]
MDRNSQGNLSLREDSPAKDRILTAALDLFYEKGYPNTGINEILEHAGAFKKSLYRHFPSKKDLGRTYLATQERIILALFQKLMDRKSSYPDFIHSWMRVVKRGTESTFRFGCPVANFANQTHDEPELQELTGEFIRRWTELFETYLRKTFPDTNRDKISRTTESILLYYQGTMQVYGMTGDPKYLQKLERELLRLEADLT